MTTCVIYLDESGDLGFNFSAPYGQGGSSRYLTLAAAICPDDSNKYLKRFISDFYTKRGVAAGAELKWTHLKQPDRLEFAKLAVKLSMQRPVQYASISVYKPKVEAHIRNDANKLYNYMVKLLLLDVMKRFERVTFVPDARSIKVKSGNSLHDYLQTTLWLDESAPTQLNTQPIESTNCRPLHFTDYLCGVVQSHWEHNAHDAWEELRHVTSCRQLFFP
jgi:hypothetical protein